MTENLTSAERVIGAVELKDVRLVKGDFWSAVVSPKEAGIVNIQIDGEAKTSRDEVPNGFAVDFTGKVTLRPKDAKPEAQPVLGIGVTLRLTYGLPAGFEATDEELKAFAGLNGTFNAWPYFREFVQTASARMGLPPIMIPVLRFPRKPTERAQTKATLGESPAKRHMGRKGRAGTARRKA
jgi:hypothetical protein